MLDIIIFADFICFYKVYFNIRFSRFIRPCIIIQTNAVSDLWMISIIVPITTKKLNKIYPYEVFIEKNMSNWLDFDSKVKLDQIRTIDKSRIWEKIWEINNKILIRDIFIALDILMDKQWDFRS